MNLFIKKSQGKLQNDAHLHDIINEIKELANPLWISRTSIEELNQRLSIQSGKKITSYEDWLLHENRGIIYEMIDEFRKTEWKHPDSK
ncbi:hypothetical protein P4V61_29510 [Bacillus thuringiensis]|nr:hypothetical protein [Bacillus thuringiensis]